MKQHVTACSKAWNSDINWDLLMFVSCELFHFVVLVIVLMSPSGAAACLPVAAQGDIYEPG